MKLRWLIVGGVLVALATAALGFRSLVSSRHRPAPAPAAARTASSSLRLGSPSLTPDARLLIAVGEVHRIVTRRPFEAGVAQFERGMWRIRHRGVDVGAVPELPEYRDLTQLLCGWAARLGVRNAFPERPNAQRPVAAMQRLDDMHAVLAAAECDRLSSGDKRSAELLKLGTRALIAVQLETTDLVGTTDRVAGRALALLAMSQAIDSTALERESCLLAHQLGYGAHAWRTAGKLAERDPIRLFVRQEDSLLTAVATARGASREAAFLHLQRLARSRDLERWTAWLERTYTRDAAMSLPILGTAFTVGRFESQVEAGSLVLFEVANQLRLLEALAADSTRNGPPTLGSLVARFEGTMGRMQPSADGMFVDRELLRAYYRGSFYSSLWIIGEHYRNALSSLPAAEEFATAFAGLDGPAGEFGRWYTHLSQAKAGNASLATLRKDLGGIPSFGAPLLLETMSEIRDVAPYGSLDLRRAAIVLAGRLDTRPAHRYEMSRLAGRDLLMLPLSEDLMRSAAATLSPLHPESQGGWARLNDDRGALESLLARPDLTAAQCGVLLDNLRHVSTADSAVLCRAFAQSIQRHPGSWPLVAEFVDYANLELKAYPLSRQAIERWLTANAQHGGLEAVIATVSLARTYQREGRWAESLRIVGPVARSQQFGAMARAAMALEHVGRGAEAETLAMFAWQRYPDNAAAQSLVAEIFWRHGNHAMAADVLSNTQFRLTPDEWRWTLAPQFVECFAGRDDEALKAVAALVKVGLRGPATLGQLATGCGNEGRRDLAFDIEQLVQADGPERSGQLFRSYLHLSRWKGVPAGLDWLRPRLASLDEGGRAMVLYEAFRNGNAELMWEMGPVPKGTDGEFEWLLRAAASRRWPDLDAGHGRALAAHFGRRSGDRYRILGRYLLGLESESTVLALADSPENECEVSYYLGVRAESEGSYRQAAESYARCLATGHSKEGEFQWAYAQLQEWQKRHLTLGKLAEVERSERGGSLMAGGGATVPAVGN